MFANIFAKTLRDQRHGLIGWGAGIAVTMFVMAAIWPSFSDMDFDAMLAQYPEVMRELFNITSMSTAQGYLNTELFTLMLPAIFIIFAVARGARLIAGEEEDGTLDLLATMPVSRRRVVLEKGAALAVSIAVLAAVLFASTILSSLVFGLDIPVLHVVPGTLAMFFIGIEFGFVALALSAGTGHRGFATGISAGMAGAAYLAYLVAQLIDGLRPLRVLSPFYQATSRGPLGPSLPPIAWVMLVVGIVAIAISIPVFERRDLGA